MWQEGMAARTGSKNLTNTSMKLRARGGVRHSQHLRRGLAIKSVASKGGNLTPVPGFPMSGMPSAVRGGKVKLASNREETVPDWEETKCL